MLLKPSRWRRLGLLKHLLGEVIAWFGRGYGPLFLRLYREFPAWLRDWWLELRGVKNRSKRVFDHWWKRRFRHNLGYRLPCRSILKIVFILRYDEPLVILKLRRQANWTWARVLFLKRVFLCGLIFSLFDHYNLLESYFFLLLFQRLINLDALNLKCLWFDVESREHHFSLGCLFLHSRILLFGRH